ncbi:rod shape determining protein RodA [Mariniphaga anaerophila]|uniref:Cell wall polymerase n=1 Tax=Mariniphaga anaerophila TaxID=1484053 RepID=A0A1M5FW76_9BACT|nr:rod shape-determining protein RodA [Mariniphaga anaerophila]SHF95716.1 rod shape determining protein RodA [Mariniphaga anaerophila]
MPRRNQLWTNIDWLTVFIYLVLVFLGWINIYAAVYDAEHQSIFDISQRYGKQLLWIGAALLIAFAILLIETNFYVFFSYAIYGAVILLLVFVLFAGNEVNNSKSWIAIGGFAIQPAEFGKFATALALAKYMSTFGFKLQRFWSLVIIGFIIFFPAALILLQNDTGSALVYFVFVLVLYREGLSGVVLFFATLIGLMFILSLVLSELVLFALLSGLALLTFFVVRAGTKHFFKVLLFFAGAFILLAAVNYLARLGYQVEHVLAGMILLGGVGIIAYSMHNKLKSYTLIALVFMGSVLFSLTVDYAFDNLLEPYQQARINELLGIESDPLGVGYNVNQSKIAIGSGGFWGKGFLNGTQTKFNFVPEQSTDFIFCTVGEEWGFAGTLVVVLLFLTLFVRLIFLAERQRSGFSRIYGYSVAVILFFHFMVNIGMTIGMMPVIGIPLPFFSYGGSSLWAFTILLFIFLRLDASRLDHLSN